jgi:hypothetical protein
LLRWRAAHPGNCCYRMPRFASAVQSDPIPGFRTVPLVYYELMTAL